MASALWRAGGGGECHPRVGQRGRARAELSVNLGRHLQGFDRPGYLPDKKAAPVAAEYDRVGRVQRPVPFRPPPPAPSVRRRITAAFNRA